MTILGLMEMTKQNEKDMAAVKGDIARIDSLLSDIVDELGERNREVRPQIAPPQNIMDPDEWSMAREIEEYDEMVRQILDDEAEQEAQEAASHTPDKFWMYENGYEDGYNDGYADASYDSPIYET